MEQFAPYIGLPFKELGRSRDGVDCYGLVRLVLWEVFKIATSDYSDYRIAERQDCAQLIRTAARNTEWEEVPNPKPGDVVLFNITGQPMHCGMVIGEGLFMHASHGNGVCAERLTSPSWNRRISRFYRHKELIARG